MNYPPEGLLNARLHRAGPRGWQHARSHHRGFLNNPGFFSPYMRGRIRRRPGLGWYLARLFGLASPRGRFDRRRFRRRFGTRGGEDAEIKEIEDHMSKKLNPVDIIMFRAFGDKSVLVAVMDVPDEELARVVGYDWNDVDGLDGLEGGLEDEEKGEKGHLDRSALRAEGREYSFQSKMSLIGEDSNLPPVSEEDAALVCRMGIQSAHYHYALPDESGDESKETDCAIHLDWMDARRRILGLDLPENESVEQFAMRLSRTYGSYPQGAKIESAMRANRERLARLDRDYDIPMAAFLLQSVPLGEESFGSGLHNLKLLMRVHPSVAARFRPDFNTATMHRLLALRSATTLTSKDLGLSAADVIGDPGEEFSATDARGMADLFWKWGVEDADRFKRRNGREMAEEQPGIGMILALVVIQAIDPEWHEEKSNKWFQRAASKSHFPVIVLHLPSIFRFGLHDLGKRLVKSGKEVEMDGFSREEMKEYSFLRSPILQGAAGSGSLDSVKWLMKNLGEGVLLHHVDYGQNSKVNSILGAAARANSLDIMKMVVDKYTEPGTRRFERPFAYEAQTAAVVHGNLEMYKYLDALALIDRLGAIQNVYPRNVRLAIKHGRLEMLQHFRLIGDYEIFLFEKKHLMAAIQSKFTEKIFEFMVSHGTDEYKRGYRNTPLPSDVRFALKSKRTRLIEERSEKAAASFVDFMVELGRHYDVKPDSSDLLAAAKRGNVKIFKKLYEHRGEGVGLTKDIVDAVQYTENPDFIASVAMAADSAPLAAALLRTLKARNPTTPLIKLAVKRGAVRVFRAWHAIRLDGIPVIDAEWRRAALNIESETKRKAMVGALNTKIVEELVWAASRKHGRTGEGYMSREFVGRYGLTGKGDSPFIIPSWVGAFIQAKAWRVLARLFKPDEATGERMFPFHSKYVDEAVKQNSENGFKHLLSWAPKDIKLSQKAKTFYRALRKKANEKPAPVGSVRADGATSGSGSPAKTHPSDGKLWNWVTGQKTKKPKKPKKTKKSLQADYLELLRDLAKTGGKGGESFEASVAVAIEDPEAAARLLNTSLLAVVNPEEAETPTTSATIRPAFKVLESLAHQIADRIRREGAASPRMAAAVLHTISGTRKRPVAEPTTNILNILSDVSDTEKEIGREAFSSLFAAMRDSTFPVGPGRSKEMEELRVHARRLIGLGIETCHAVDEERAESLFVELYSRPEFFDTPVDRIRAVMQLKPPGYLPMLQLMHKRVIEAGVPPAQGPASKPSAETVRKTALQLERIKFISKYFLDASTVPEEMRTAGKIATAWRMQIAQGLSLKLGTLYPLMYLPDFVPDNPTLRNKTKSRAADAAGYGSLRDLV